MPDSISNADSKGIKFDDLPLLALFRLGFSFPSLVCFVPPFLFPFSSASVNVLLALSTPIPWIMTNHGWTPQKIVIVRQSDK